jgi:hypothetical protein
MHVSEGLQRCSLGARALQFMFCRWKHASRSQSWLPVWLPSEVR